jgi:hypothetical protein
LQILLAGRTLNEGIELGSRQRFAIALGGRNRNKPALRGRPEQKERFGRAIAHLPGNRGPLGRQGRLHGSDRLLLHGNRFLNAWFRIGRLGSVLGEAGRPNRQQNEKWI